jgi:WD40 repeat protein
MAFFTLVQVLDSGLWSIKTIYMIRNTLFLLSLTFLSFISANEPEITRLDKNKDIVYDIGISGTDKLVAMESDAIITWDINKKSVIHTYQDPQAGLTCMDVSGQGNLIAFGNKHGQIAIIRTGTSEMVYQKFYSEKGPVADIKFSPDDSQLGVVFATGNFMVADYSSNNSWGNNIPEGRATCIGFRDDGEYFAIGNDQGVIVNYSIVRKDRVSKLSTSAKSINDIFWVSDADKMVIVSKSGKILTYNGITSADGPGQTSLIQNSGAISGSGYIPESNSLYTCTLQGTVKIHFNFGVYKYSFPVATHAIKYLPLDENFYTLAVATNGKGILLLNSRNMSLNKR